MNRVWRFTERWVCWFCYDACHLYLHESRRESWRTGRSCAKANQP